MHKPVQEALAVAQEAKKQINALLTGVDQGTNLLSINTNFRQIEHRLSFMGAVVEPDTQTGKDLNEQFPPITDFMGEKIEVSKVELADLNPLEAEKKKFVAKVEKLQGVIIHMSVEEVLKNYVSQDDLFVLRGVAKKAGVPDYDRALINAEFVQKIKDAVTDKADKAVVQTKVDEVSSSQKKQEELEKLLKERAEVVSKIEFLTKEHEASKASVTDKSKPEEQAKVKAILDKITTEISELETRQLEIEEILETNKVEY